MWYGAPLPPKMGSSAPSPNCNLDARGSGPQEAQESLAEPEWQDLFFASSFKGEKICWGLDFWSSGFGIL